MTVWKEHIMLFFKPAEEEQADLTRLPRHIAIIMDGNKQKYG